MASRKLVRRFSREASGVSSNSQCHGHRYFAWGLSPDGRFCFWVDRAKLRAELRVEGTYVLQTNGPTLHVQQAVAAYKELQTVERGFRCLKDVLAIRPIYHPIEPRVRAHLFVAHLAPVLGVALEVALRRAGLALSLDTALEALPWRPSARCGWSPWNWTVTRPG